MALKVANRGMVPPFIVMDVMRAAAEKEATGDRVLHLEVGQPGSAAPAKVIAAAKQALDCNKIGYTLALGLDNLRERIAQYYRDYYSVSVDPSRVVVTTGSSSGFLLTFLSAFEAGDRVGVCSPGYPAYRNILKALGVTPVDIPVSAETDFHPTPEIISSIEGGLDGLLIASPSNPTGSMLSAEELKGLCAFCRGQGIRFISDEIYHGITYGKEAQTALEYDDEVIVINSFSKYFSMTGWRLGWMVIPEALLRSVECLAQNMYISPPTLSQFAGIAAFDCIEELDGNVARYARSRELLLSELPKAGFGKLAPADGAFYLYADVERLTNDSQDFCRRMLAETGVAATPGVDFDPEQGHRFMRFSFAGSTDDMGEAAQRLIAWKP